MHPSLINAIASDRREDLLRASRRQQRAARKADTTTGRAWAVRLGWLLIRVGCHLVARRATPAQLDLSR